jgi:hypothetical protein
MQSGSPGKLAIKGLTLGLAGDGFIGYMPQIIKKRPQII